MHFFVRLSCIIAFLTLSVMGLAEPNAHSLKRRHFGRAGKSIDDFTNPDYAQRLGKRDGDMRMSFYEAGMGACGVTNSDSDYIVALNTGSWDGGSHCGESITINYLGKTAQATIMDECMGCPDGGIDLTPGLFSFFAPTSAGIIYGTWGFGSLNPTTSATPTPTTTSTPPPSTSTSATSTSSSASSSKTTSAPSTSTATSSSATDSATPSPTAGTFSGNGPNMLSQYNAALLGIAYLISSGGQG